MGELHREVVKIAAETGDEEVRMLWQSAGMLHQNFYENWLPREMVEGNIKDVKRFVEKLRKILEKTTTP
jgi:PaREP1/PaREP8 domain containing family protein